MTPGTSTPPLLASPPAEDAATTREAVAPTREAAGESAFASPTDGLTLQQSRMFRVAGSGFTTTIVVLFELMEFVAVLMIGDLAWADVAGRPPYADHGYSQVVLLGVLGVLQLALAGIELVASRRQVRARWTLPLVFLPFGRSLRFGLVLACAAFVLIPKLLVYFLYLTVALPFLWLLSRVGLPIALRAIDMFDVTFEPLELGVAWLYNLLFYGKIEPRGTAFTPAFNLWLSLWCLNH